MSACLSARPRGGLECGIGARDEVNGDPHRLAALFARGEALEIPGRDHNLAVGDKVYKAGVLAFLDALA